MIAGTLAVLYDTVDEPLETFSADKGRYPALVVNVTQETHGEATPQAGKVAAQLEVENTEVVVTEDQDGDLMIDSQRVTEVEPIATAWYADLTGSGVILAESVSDSNAERPFPFGLFSATTGSWADRQQIDVETLHDDWEDTDRLGEVWMGAGDADIGTQINYHGAASEVDPTIGIGFERAWNGKTIKGIVYASGYVALYSVYHTTDGLQFIADEILPYASTWDADEHGQQTDFDEFGGDA